MSPQEAADDLLVRAKIQSQRFSAAMESSDKREAIAALASFAEICGGVKYIVLENDLPSERLDSYDRAVMHMIGKLSAS
jgi:hypothetical protein